LAKVIMPAMNAIRDSRKKILIVDDNKHLLVTLGDYLTFEGYEISTAVSAEDGLKQLEKAPVDLVILDVGMPGMGGIGFLKKISGEDGKLMYPVLVLTARSSMEVFFEAVAVDGFLAKPCTEAALVHKIREILVSRSAPDRTAERRRPAVLLVENKRRTATEVSGFLQAAGFDVEVVSCGSEALDRASASDPDVIVVKELLPKMNGATVCSMLKSMSTAKATPLVLYDTSRALEAVRGYQYTAPEGVEKIVASAEPAVLLSAVREVLKM
jgi:DNA-binding response OmpR family regulator